MFKKLFFTTFSWWILTPTNPQFDNGWKLKVKAILTKIKGFLSILCLSVYLYVCFFVSSKRQKCWTDRDQLFFGTSRDPLPRTRFDFWKFRKFTKKNFIPRNVCLFWFYNADMQKIRQKLRIYIFCLSGCLSFCLYKKNVETAGPYSRKYFVWDLKWPLVRFRCSELQNIVINI